MIVIKQDTSAFEYYIVKYMIFKSIIFENDHRIINKPVVLIDKVLQNKFTPEKFIDVNSPRMTLFELK
jgi:hypothetical protein